MHSLRIFVFGAIAIAVAAWTFSSSHGGGTSFHPFRSEEAKQIYLEYYDERARSVPGESMRMVPTLFGDTHVRVSGPVGASPLVLLPGDSETSLNWEPQLTALSQRYRTYAVDNVYDYGRSVYSRPIKVPGDYVQWLEEVFAGLDIDKGHLVGFSYGGWQASLFALDHPERLLSLTLIAPPSTVIAPGWEILIRGILQWVFPTRLIVKNYLYWYCADSVRQGRATDVDDMVEEVLLSSSCFKRRDFYPPTLLTDDEWQQLAQSPVLFMMGENDVTYPAAQAMERLAQFDISTRLIPNAGHDLRTIQADRVNREILSFLKSIDG